MFLFLGIFCGATILAGIGININHWVRVTLGGVIYIASIAAMKRAVALSQREYTISSYHRISAERLAASLHSGGRPTMKPLESGKREADERILSVIEGCQPATTFWRDRTDAVDAAIESNEYSSLIPTHG